MQQFYTLEEASRLLNTTVDELKAMARRGELRSFQDRGTLRFRGQEIDELVRRRGLGNSDPDLQLGESKAAGSGEPGKLAGSQDKGTFDFNLSLEDSDEVAIGKESAEMPGKPMKKGSDSDVRLVSDGSDLDFQIDSDSDVRMVEDAPSGPKSGNRKHPADPVAKGDSGVRLVEASGSDSGVKIVQDGEDAVALGADLTKRPSDSDIRLEDASPAARSPGDKKKKKDPVTEEFDLDAELQQADTAARQKGSSDVHRAAPSVPGTSPFELSDADVPVPKKKPARKTDSSDDFELTPAKEDHSPIELGSDDLIALQPVEESAEVPADKGKSKSAAKSEADSSSEFELSLEDAGSSPVSEDDSSSSDFDLSLDENEAAVEGEGSDSEFELTLDGSGGLVSTGDSGEQKDIFESDFEVPALEEESGSEAVALDESDTDLESSDFDLALGDEDAPSDETTGSQVVALEDEEDSDPEAATVMKTRRGARAAVAEDEEAGEFDNLDLEGEDQEVVTEDVEEEPVTAGAGAYAPPKPARWGAIPVIFMLPCVILMFLVGLMSWEMMNIMWGYHQGQKVSGLVVPWVTETFLGKDKAPKD